MEFENSFDVPLPPDRAWAALLDIPRMVRCMPGAELVEVVDPSTFKGKVTVRLGPVTMNFAGIVKFTEMNSANHRAVANAKGNDAKGRGTASAMVQFGLAPSPEGSRVNIRTSLSLTGSVAQYGRASGVIKELANQITLEFAQRLRAQIDEENAGSKPIQELSAPAKGATPSSALPSLAASASPVGSLSAGKLVWNVIWAYVLRLFGRQTG